MRVGFACQWDRKDRKRTWSHTPYHLLSALQQLAQQQVVDMPIELPRLRELLVKLRYARPHPTGLLSVASWTPAMYALRHRALLRAAASATNCDAVITIGENGPIDAPQFVYQDQSVGQFIEYYNAHGRMADVRDVPPMHLLKSRTEIEQHTYSTLAGVLTMSHWNARHVIATGSIAADRVHVVGAGINVASDLPTQDDVARRLEKDSRTVLFVGRHFHRKGGDIVVAGVERARQLSGQTIRLVVAGPTAWPLPGEPPAWVEFIGDAPLERVQKELRQADVLALPSRFEAYGIAVLEALAGGVPVIGRNDFAMPEMIEAGRTGALVDGDADEQFAEALLSVLGNETIAWETLLVAPEVRARHAWPAVARKMLDGVEMTL
ncbi:MAG: glycosyltransferase family 4 protein [Candidatus Kapabacteria bacterium]|nr:glycosyltransferase family 4 protein [Candidatus Kapabacteria bacterium]